MTDNFRVRARFICRDERYSYSALFEIPDVDGQKLGSDIPPLTVRVHDKPQELTVDFDVLTQLCTRDELLYCDDEYDATSVPSIPRHSRGGLSNALMIPAMNANLATVDRWTLIFPISYLRISGSRVSILTSICAATSTGEKLGMRVQSREGQ